MQFNLSLAKPSPNLISVAGEWLFSVNRKTRGKNNEKNEKKEKKKKEKNKCKKPETKSLYCNGSDVFLWREIFSSESCFSCCRPARPISK